MEQVSILSFINLLIYNKKLLVLNCLGAWVRYIGKNSDGFPIALTGQSIAAVAQTFILAIPPKVAANWFPNTERTLATSIAAIFNQLGIAGGFYMSPGIGI